VLTQFNSASLNRHIAETYRMDLFSRGFVEILAAEQTPDNPNWFQGTADAVRQAARHFAYHDAEYYLILAGDHLYRMDYTSMIDEHIERGSDITIAAQPVSAADAPAMGIFRFDKSGQIVGFEEKPNAERLNAIGSSIPSGSRFMLPSAEKPFVASMGIYVFTREVLLEALEQHAGVDFGHEIIPAALSSRRVNAYIFRGYWQDVGTVASFYDANIMLTRREAPFNFYDPQRPVFTRPRFLPASRVDGCHIDEAVIAEGANLEDSDVRQSIVGIRACIGRGCKISRSVLLGADFYEKDDDAPAHDGGGPPLGIGEGSVLDRVIVDKNARIGRGVRLTNEAGVEHADGDGFHIRNGIIIVPKWGVVRDGTVA
jgi:glucose-1-phosphate adenylyltransferase